MIDVIKDNVEDVVNISISDLMEAMWNPQSQSTATFNNLVEEIRVSGFDEPILVIKKDKKYLIVAGNHRYRAAKVLSMKEIPCIVKEWSEDEAKIKAVQRNLLKGTLDEAKFNVLVNGIKDGSKVTDEELARAMAFDSIEDFYDIYKLKEEEREETEKKVTSEYEDISDELNMVDNVSTILNEIFSNYGTDVAKNFIFFMYKKKMHLCVDCDAELAKMIEIVIKYIGESGINARDFFKEAIKNTLKS